MPGSWLPSSFLQLIHDIFAMREKFGKSIESLDSLREKAKFTKKRAKLFENMLVVSENREAKLKE